MSIELALIAALDRNHAIGRGNALPWHLPDDLKRFKRLTLGHSVLMGRRTAESIGRALPGRTNLVLTRHGQAPFAGQLAVASLEQAITRSDSATVFVIGGAEIYALCLPRTDRLYLTWVDTAIADADTWFPEFDPSHWCQTASEPHPADARHPWPFRFADYARSD